MRTLGQLIDAEDPGIVLLREWAAGADAHDNVLLPPDMSGRDAALLRLQVTTRSLLGAVVYETGGILVDGGRLRLLGSGANRSIVASNEAVGGMRLGASNDFILVADDVLGGLFALNGGRFANGEKGEVFHLAADATLWSPLDIGYSDFVSWCLTGDLAELYGAFSTVEAFSRRPAPGFDKVFSFYPFLWTREGRSSSSVRLIEADESLRLRLEMLGFAVD